MIFHRLPRFVRSIGCRSKSLAPRHPSHSLTEQAGWSIEPQIGFSFVFVRSMTSKTVLGENRANVAIEGEFFGT